MNLEFTVQTRIQKPIAEVFDAVYNPEKLNKYFYPWKRERGVRGRYHSLLAILKAWIEHGYVMGMDGCSHS